jgi:hypothetical protein
MVLKRNRKIYALLMLMVIGLGLASREYAQSLPVFLASYAGDTLWALLVFLTMGFLFPALSTLKITHTALIFAFFIEVTQLYHAPWLDTLRHYRLVGLVLGYKFLWSDLLCYTVGVLLGFVVERWVYQLK